MTKDPGDEFTNKVKRLSELLASADVSDYRHLRPRLLEARKLCSELIGERATDAFNRHIATASRDTRREKQDLGRYIAEELRGLGLAVQSELGPATIQATVGRAGDAGRFALVAIGGSRRTRSKRTFPDLPRLQLVPRPDRVEPLAEAWRLRVRPSGEDGEPSIDR